jgi:hypothetical protein
MDSGSTALLKEINTLRNDLAMFRLFSEKLMAGLKFVHDRPGASPFVGLTWVSLHEFGANATIFASFLNRKPNTTRFNFRHHGVPHTERLSPNRSEQLPDAQHWQIHTCRHSLLEGDPKVIFPFSREKSPTAEPISDESSPAITDESSPTEQEQISLDDQISQFNGDSDFWNLDDLPD